MEILRFTIAAGETKVFVKAGRYFEVVTAAYPVDVGFYDTSGTQTEDARQVTSGFYARQDYSQIEIRSSVAQSVELLVSRVEAGSKQLPGVVRVVDQGAEKTRALGQYIRSVTAVATAGQFGAMFVKPTTVAVAVKNLALQSPVAGDVMVGRGAVDGTVITAGASNTAANKLVNGPDSTSLCGYGLTAAIDPVPAEIPGYSTWVRVYLPANQPVLVPMTTPIIVQGTARLYVLGLQANRAVSMIVDYEEVE